MMRAEENICEGDSVLFKLPPHKIVYRVEIFEGIITPADPGLVCDKDKKKPLLLKSFKSRACMFDQMKVFRLIDIAIINIDRSVSVKKDRFFHL